MMRTCVLPLLLLAAVIGACGDTAWPTEIEVPDGMATVPLSIRSRASEPGELLPTVTLTAEESGVRVHVARAVMCDMMGSAGYQRLGANEILFVATVGPNPAALCTATLTGVNEYEAVVPGLEPGTFNVFVYEATGTGKARFMGGGAVLVRGGFGIH